jgi:glycosyltransferase involved in cell wall biosynthesis
MKILYLSALYPPHVAGGAEITLQTLVEGVRDRGHEPVVVATRPEPGIGEERVGGVRVIRAGLRNVYWDYWSERRPAASRLVRHLLDVSNPAMGRVAYEIIRRERPDVVSAHNLPGWSVSAWGAVRRVGVPLVQVLHDLYLFCPSATMFRSGSVCEAPCARCRLLRLPHRKRSAAVDAVVGISRFVLDRHLAHGFFPRAAVREVIHNARSLAGTGRPREPRRHPGLHLGFLGTLTPAKGIEVLLQAVAALEGEGVPVTLGVAGRGEASYEATLRRRFASDRIRFLGYVDPPELFAGIDALVVPSLWEEALGMVVPEAFAHAVPVIGSRRGGIPEMIDPGENGFLFDPGAPTALKELLQRLLREPGTLQAMEPRALASARPYLDVDRWVARHCGVYEALLREAGPPR